MGITFKQYYDADPNACNDPDAQLFFGAVWLKNGVIKGAGCSLAQLQARIGGTGPVIADGEYRIEVPFADQRDITIRANVNVECDYYLFTNDTYALPADGTIAGVKQDFVGSLIFFDQAPDWVQHSGFLVARVKATKQWFKLTPEVENVEEGYTYGAIDTVDPYGTGTLQPKVGSETTTWTWNLTADDAQSGINPAETVMWQEIETGPDQVLVPAPAGTSGELQGLAGETRRVYWTIKDNQGNTFRTPTVESQLQQNVEAGTLQFRDIQPTNGDAAITISEAVAGGELEVIVDLVGNNEGAASVKTAQLGLRMWTALPGQVETLTTADPADGILTFNPAGNGTTASATLTLAITSQTDAKIRRFELYIKESTITGAPAPSAGTNNAILVELVGVGGGDEDAFPQSQDALRKTVINAVDETVAYPGINNTPFEEINIGGNDYIQQLNAQHNYTDTEPTATWKTNSPYVGYPIYFEESGNYDVYIAAQAQYSNANSYRMLLDGTDQFAPLSDGNPIGIDTDSTLRWYKYSSVLVVPSTGVHLLQIHQREARFPPLQQIFVAKTGSAYTPPAGVLAADTLQQYGEPTPDINNPTLPLGDVPTDTVVPLLSPNSGSTDIGDNKVYTVAVGGGAALQYNPGSLHVEVDTGTGYQTIATSWTVFDGSTIRCNNTAWPAGASVRINSIADIGTVLVNGVSKRIAPIVNWITTIAEQAPGGEFPAFQYVGGPAGRLDTAHFNAIQSQFTQTVQDRLYSFALAPRLRQFDANNEAEFQQYLDAAQPGDMITLPSGNVGSWSVVATRPGTATNKIIICPRVMADGQINTGQQTTFDGGKFGLKFSNPARHYIVGGVRFINQTENGIYLQGGAVTPAGDALEGCPDIRVTRCVFAGIGRATGGAEDYCHVGARSHRFEFDHNSAYGNYNGLRLREDQEKQFPTIGAWVHHNYLGYPADSNTAIDGLFYSCSAFEAGNNSSNVADTSVECICEYNIMDFDGATGGIIDGELIVLKMNGVTFRHNIVIGRQSGGQTCGLRQTHGSEIYHNYFFKCSIREFGESNHVHENIVDMNDLGSIGIGLFRWGVRPFANSTAPPTGKWNIHNNSIYNSVGNAFSIGFADPGGGLNHIYDTQTNNNLVVTSQGTAYAYEDANIGDGANTNCTFDGNAAVLTGSAVTGKGWDLDANHTTNPAGKGAQLLTYIAA